MAMDYCAVCARLPEGERVPAIALTAYARPEDRAKALAAGFRAHLTKPLDPESLLRELSDAAKDRRIRRLMIRPKGGHCSMRWCSAFSRDSTPSAISLIPHSFILFSSVL